MFKDPSEFRRIYIACGYTDLRYGVDGLANLIQGIYHLDPFDEGTLFLFCGRRKDRIKGLLWEGDGFLLIYKRLANGRYQWPRSEVEMRQMNADQYRRLVTGFAIDSAIHPSAARYAGYKLFHKMQNRNCHRRAEISPEQTDTLKMAA